MSEPTPIITVLPQVVAQIQARVATERPPREPSPPSVPVPVVPSRFRRARLETYEAETETEERALRTVRRWVEVVRDGGGPMLAIIGPQGTGKSHLLYAAAWALYAANRRASCFSWYRLADELRYGGRNPYNNAPLDSSEVRARLWESKAILLDEVRPTANTHFDDTELAKVACHCYDAEIPMLLTTNVTPLAEVLGSAAASRFSQINVLGRDRRQTEAK